MKYPLTTDVVKRLKIESKPVGVDSKVKIIAEDNPSKKEYFVFCSSQESPKGFGVRVAAGTGKKTWIIQRRSGDKVVRSKIGASTNSVFSRFSDGFQEPLGVCFCLDQCCGC